MNSVASHPGSRDVSLKSLWFSIAAGGAAWALHGVIWEIVSSQACKDGSGAWGSLSAAGVRALLGGVTLALLAVAIGAGVNALRNWRKLSDTQHLADAEARGREQFMAFFGMAVSLLFIVGIIWAGLPVLLTDVCIKAR